jgi:hypothetical protein
MWLVKFLRGRLEASLFYSDYNSGLADQRKTFPTVDTSRIAESRLDGRSNLRARSFWKYCTKLLYVAYDCY